LPVYSGKGIGTKVHRDIVLPLILIVVLYVSLLANYTWETLSVSALIYLGSLPFGFRAYSRRAEKEGTGPEPYAEGELDVENNPKPTEGPGESSAG
jgi:CDP-diacylglycerol--serine O-phosphatidyltransferase